MHSRIVVGLLIALILAAGGFVFWKYDLAGKKPAPTTGYRGDESAVNTFSADVQGFTTEERSLQGFDAIIDDVVNDQGSETVSAATLDSDLQSLNAFGSDVNSATQEQADSNTADSTFSELQN